MILPVTNVSPVFYTAEAVVNADHTITGSNGRMVMYSGLTAARVLTLPPATQMMQTIMVMDEDGSCNLTNSITLTCAGTDKIEGNPTRILNYPYSALTIESNGSGSWVVVANPNPSLSAGIQIAPTFTDNGDGSITFTSGLYCFYTNSTGIGKIKRFTLPGNTFTLTDNTNQYIVADYNAGAPTIYVTTNVAVIDEITVIPLYTVYRRGTVLHVLEWDSLGDALGNKTHKSIVKTQRFRTEPGGLGLGEAATRLVTVGSGTVWHGAVSNSLSAFNSSVNTMWLAYHVAGVWTFSTITQYNNTQYDDGTNLQTLPGGKYAVNFVYRVVGTNDTTTIVFLGQGAYSLGDAQASQPPANLPGEVLSHCVLVGRIIVSQGASTATQIDSAFSTIFSPAGVTDHNSLLNLQGGTGGQYYHLTSAEYTGTGTGNFVRLNAPTATGTWTFQGPVNITNTTASTSTTTGALVVSGGVGIGGTIYTATGGVFDGISVGLSTFPQAGIIAHATQGFSFRSSTGATYDYSVVNAANTAFVATIPTGTSNWVFNTGTVAVNNTTASTSTTTGALTVAGGLGVGGNVFAAGVNFGGSTLTHYDEGSWTPTIRGLTTSGTATYTYQLGTYRRIGNMVSVTLRLTLASFTGAAGQIAIGGLPFAVQSIANLHNGTVIGYFSGITLANKSLAGLAIAGSTDVYLYDSPGAQLLAGAVSGTAEMSTTIVYHT